MSAFIAESTILHSDSASSAEFFENVFSGKDLVSWIPSQYFPEQFPKLGGSVVSPSSLGLPDDAHYLLDSSRRLQKILDKLFANFADLLRDASHFDAVFLMKSNEAQFDFSKTYEDRFFAGRFTNKVFSAAVLQKFRELKVGSIDESKIHIVDSACASGHVAAGHIARFFRAGRWSRALVIAIDVVSVERLWLLTSLGAAASQREEGAPLYGPFSRGRNGFHESDVGVMAILESESACRERGTPSSSRITSVYQNADGETLTSGSQGAARLIECLTAISQGHEIRAVKAHGTGTPLNDTSEAFAINQVFGNERPMVISLKGQIGHTLTASGLVELLICDQMLRRKRAPGCHRLIDPEGDLSLISEAQDFSAKKMLLNAFGFGGSNACLILEAN